MKILHAILSKGFYGSERYCAELAAQQARDGHEVKILIESADSDCARAMRTMVPLATAGAGTLRLVALPQWLPTWLHRPFGRMVLRRFEPHVVHTHLNPATRRVGRTAQRLRIPHIATLHIDFDAREHDSCDALIALASWQRAKAPPQYRDKIAVVWCWLPSLLQSNLADARADAIAALRRRWKADNDTIVIGSVGRLVPEKGMDVLIRAFRAAFPRGDEPVRLVLVGGGDERHALEQLATGDPRIILTGPQERMALHYRAFDVFVSAARFEPFGIAIVEAMAAGLPLVVTRTEGPKEFATDARIIWAQPGDQDTLASALAKACTGDRQHLIYDLGPFSQDHAARQIEAVYRRLIASGPKPHRQRGEAECD